MLRRRQQPIAARQKGCCHQSHKSVSGLSPLGRRLHDVRCRRTPEPVMLGIGKLAVGAEDYYLAISAGIEDYYVGMASPGQWIASSQRLLGLSGEIDPDTLRTVFAGLEPTTDAPLLNSANRTVMAFDLTFKADKSVSLLHAFGITEVAAAVEAAHSAAVASSIHYLEESAVHTRRGHNGVETIHGTGLVAASFRHYRNRNDDPHLHDHVLVPNMVQGTDGRWSTLDARHLYAHAKTAGYVYQAVLRDQLTRTLGVEFGPVNNGVAPIEGIPRRAIDAFSTRRAEILEHLDAVGASSAKAAQIATLQTRRAKEHQPDLDAIQAEWRTRAIANGLDPERLGDVLGRTRAEGLSEPERKAAIGQMLGPDGLTAHSSTFDRRDLIRAWCEAHPQGAPLSEVQFFSAQMIANEPSMVALAGERWTTRELLAFERTVLDSAQRGLGLGVATVPLGAIDAAIAARPTITAEQEHVARAIVEGGDGVSVLIAPAGTGKGFTLGVAQAAWSAVDVNVLGATVAARAATELRTGAGIPSMTIASLIGQLDDGKALARGSVLVIDEAGMVGTRQLARLVEHASTRGAKVVLVGDPRQLPEIDAGGVLGGLAQHVPVLTLSENRRQSEPWERAALNQFRSGSVQKALDAFESHGRIERVATLAEVRARIVDAWATAHNNGEEPIMLAARREDVRALNKLARVTMAEHLVGPMLVVDGEPFQAGDHVMTLRNNRHLDVRNGERGTLQAINADRRSMTVQMTDRVVELPSSYLEAGHVTHGYAMTVHKAQGVTADRAFVHGTDDLYREMGYVAMSRGRLGNHLYVVGEPTREIEPLHGPSLERSNEELLVAALSTSRAQELASAQVNPLADIPHVSLVAERNDLELWLRSLPKGLAPRIARLTEHIDAHQDRIATLQEQQADERETRRSVRHVLSRHDERGRATGYKIDGERRFLAQAIERRDELTGKQVLRHAMIAERGDVADRLLLVEAEIERRVGVRIDVALVSPGEYLTRELGERPDDPELGDVWREGVGVIERFRFEHDITNERIAFFGHNPREIRAELAPIKDDLDLESPSLGMGMRM